MILLKNGRMIDPKSKKDDLCDILIEGEKIKKIAKDIQEPEAETIDATGLVIAPGLIDTHVHFRDPGFTYKEDIESGAKAAAAGGFTTVILMANTKPVVDNEETLRYVLEKGKKTDIRMETCCAVSKGLRGEELVDMKALLSAGAVGFTDDGIPLLDEEKARLAMEEAAKYDTVLSFHEEDPKYIKNSGFNSQKAAEHYGIGGADRMAEISMVERDIRMAGESGASIVIQHISAKESVDLVREGKASGVRVHAEATPHHFSLTEEAAIQYGTMAKMNPPLRQESDRMAIIKGLEDGTIDLIATDHAPHAKEEKEKALLQAPSGIIGLETSLSLGIMNLVDPGYLTLPKLLEKMTINPATLYKLDLGYIAEGGPADLVIFDPDEEWTPTRFVSRSQNSPFLNQKLKGKIKTVLCRGKIIFVDAAKGSVENNE